MDTDFADTDLPDTDLPDTDLPDTDFEDTDFEDTDFEDTDLAGSAIEDTDVEESTLDDGVDEESTVGGARRRSLVPAVPGTAEGQGLRKATALMAVGTTLSRANGVLRLFALGYAFGTLGWRTPTTSPTRCPTSSRTSSWGGSCRPRSCRVRAPAHAPRRRRGLGCGLRGGECHLIVISVASLVFLLAVPFIVDATTALNHSADAAQTPAAGQGPAVPVRAPADLLRLHQRGHGAAQRPAPLRGAHVHPRSPTTWCSWPCCSSSAPSCATPRCRGGRTGQILFLGLGTTAGVVIQAGP